MWIPAEGTLSRRAAQRLTGPYLAGIPPQIADLDPGVPEGSPRTLSRRASRWRTSTPRPPTSWEQPSSRRWPPCCSDRSRQRPPRSRTSPPARANWPSPSCPVPAARQAGTPERSRAMWRPCVRRSIWPNDPTPARSWPCTRHSWTATGTPDRAPGGRSRYGSAAGHRPRPRSSPRHPSTSPSPCTTSPPSARGETWRPSSTWPWPTPSSRPSIPSSTATGAQDVHWHTRCCDGRASLAASRSPSVPGFSPTPAPTSRPWRPSARAGSSRLSRSS